MAAPTNEAMQTRILNHMNADHQNSLVLYSRYYSKLPLSHAKTSKLDSLNLEHMIIESSFGRCLVPFSPPLESYSDARERVVAMHQECLRGLDVDEVVIDRYSLPSGPLQCTLAFLTTWTFATFPFRAQLSPESGSLLSWAWSIGGLFPGLARLAYLTAPYVLVFMVVVHGAEAAHMARGRLRRHSVEAFSGVWWAWVVDTFFEGFGAYQRFDGMVEKRRKDKGQEKKDVGKQMKNR